MSIINFYFLKKSVTSFTWHIEVKFKVWKIFKKIGNNIIKDIRNFSRIKKKTNDTAIKEIRYIFRVEKEINDTTFKRYKKSF